MMSRAGSKSSAGSFCTTTASVSTVANWVMSVTQAFGPHAEDAPERRLVGLRYGAVDSAGPRALAEVEVDLSRQKLIRFEDIEAVGREN